MIALIFSGCGGGNPVIPPSVEDDDSDLILIEVNDSDSNLIGIVGKETGEGLGAYGEIDSSNNSKKLTEALYISEQGDKLKIELGNDGLPVKLIDHEENMVVFENYTDSTVDILVYNSAGNLIDGPITVEIDSDELEEMKESQRTTNFLHKDLHDVADFLKEAGYKIKWASCMAYSSIGYLPGVALACGSAVISDYLSSTPDTFDNILFASIGIASPTGIVDPAGTVAGVATLLGYFLEDVATTADYLNSELPVIDNLIANPNPVEPGEITNITCYTSNQEYEQKYIWYTSGIENFSEGVSEESIATQSEILDLLFPEAADRVVTNVRSIHWTAPDNEGVYTIMCMVKNGNKHSGKSIDITVASVSGDITNVSPLTDPFTLGTWYTTNVYVKNTGDISYTFKVKASEPSGTDFEVSEKSITLSAGTTNSVSFKYKFYGAKTEKLLTFELYDNINNLLDTYTTGTLYPEIDDVKVLQSLTVSPDTMNFTAIGQQKDIQEIILGWSDNTTSSLAEGDATYSDYNSSVVKKVSAIPNIKFESTGEGDTQIKVSYTDGNNVTKFDYIDVSVGSTPSLPAPTGVTASDGTHNNKVALSCNTVTGATHYQFYRATSSTGTKTALGSWQTGATYDDFDASPAVTYYYFVRAATSSSGANASPYSPYDTGWKALIPPQNVSATDGLYTDQVRITWDSVPGASYYRVYRAASSGGTKTALGSWQTGTTYYDTTVTPGTTYYYFVTAAINSSGDRESIYSTSNTGYAESTTPIAPYVTASDGTHNNKVALSCNSVTGATHYQFYRAASSTGTKAALGSWQTGTTYYDTTVNPGTTYYYFVTAAINSSGDRESIYSTYNTGYASNTLGSITVTTKDISGNLISGSKNYILYDDASPNWNVIDSAITSLNSYTFTGLSAGTYNVESYKSDMTIWYGVVVDISLSTGQNKSVTIIAN